MKPVRNHPPLLLWLALFIAAASLPLTIVLAQSGGGYNLEWNTYDAGGHTFSSGGGYTLGGTVGQPDAGTLSGGAYTLNGGFWNGLASPQAITRYAVPTAQGNGDCSDWADACTLQTAMANAVSGDEIWVKMGVHYPGSNRTDTFTLKNGVAIYGGFDGTEIARDQRNPQANPTILSGDIDRNDNHGGDSINENASQIVGNNAYHVLTGGGTNSTAILDGFIITAGQANGSSTDHSGGGMINTSSSPTLRNLIFSGNSASSRGGGMYNDSSRLTPTKVAFSGNSADYGSGMYNHNNSNPTLVNITFSGNSANQQGGGMFNDTNSSPTLTNVTFSGNSATYGGGMYNYSSSSPTLTNVIIWGNSAPTGPEIANDYSIPSISYSDIQGGYPGTGNIDADPLFVNAANGNLRLGFGSPAVDTGTNTGCPAADLDGLPRPADGHADSTAICDMGTYEAGTMLCSAPYTFNDQSGVSVEVVAAGNLACLYVDEMGLNHPNATPGIQTGRYWLIRGLQGDKVTDASGFSVNLTLPTTFTPDANDKVCRYPGNLGGAGWDCAMSSFTATSVTRNGVSAFSDWAVGNNVGPTAFRLTSFQVSSSHSPLVWLLLPAILAMAVFFAKKRPAKP